MADPQVSGFAQNKTLASLHAHRKSQAIVDTTVSSHIAEAALSLSLHASSLVARQHKEKLFSAARTCNSDLVSALPV